jgi:hypothetical protein
MRRILLILAAGALLVVLMATTVSPALAKQNTQPGNGWHGAWDRTHPSDPGCEGWRCEHRPD